MNAKVITAAEVALFLPSLGGGGAERIMVILANNFVEKGVSVDLVLVKCEGPYLKELNSKVRIFDLKAKRLLTAIPGFILYLLRRKPANILATLSHVNVLAILSKFFTGSKARVIVREAGVPEKTGMESNRFWKKVQESLIGKIYRNANWVVAISGAMEKYLLESLRVPSEKIVKIFNPVISEELFYKANVPLQHKWFFEANVPVILSIGRLSEEKNYQLLIQAFKIVLQFIDCYLVILGEGPERKDLEKHVSALGLQNKVDLPGFVDNPFNYLKKAAVFVSSSKREGLPNALIQSIALGVPVVATDCPGGSSEILGNGRFGRLVAVDDEKEMAMAIVEQLKSVPDLKAQESVISRFSLSDNLERYFALLKF